MYDDVTFRGKNLPSLKINRRSTVKILRRKQVEVHCSLIQLVRGTSTLIRFIQTCSCYWDMCVGVNRIVFSSRTQQWPPWGPPARNWKNSTIHFREFDFEFRSVQNWNNLLCIRTYAFLKNKQLSSFPNVTRWKPRCFCQLVVVRVKKNADLSKYSCWISNQQGMPNDSQVLVIKYRVKKLSDSSSSITFPA